MYYFHVLWDGACFLIFLVILYMLSNWLISMLVYVIEESNPKAASWFWKSRWWLSVAGPLLSFLFGRFLS
ncbi:hypothetical protein D3C74_49860 [compost metagenome]